MAISDEVDMRKMFNEMEELGEAFKEAARVADIVLRKIDDLYWPVAWQRPAKTWAKPWWAL